MEALKVEIKPDVYWVGVNDRRKDLFEGIWPLPRGVSYNSYLVVDEKVAVIDTSERPFTQQWYENITQIVDPSRIAYVIANHMEPDHSGSLPFIRKMVPDATIVLTAKAKDMLANFYGIVENVRVVSDGEEISLGHKTLRFYEIPFVHWPETMATYIVEDQILCSCDAFGTFGALDGGFFDDEVDVDYYIDEMLRYYSNIVAMYSVPVQRALAKLKELPISVIAPSHGPIWRNDVARVVGLYDRWSRWEGEQGVALIYGSMYGNTLDLMEAVGRGVVKGGCKTLRVFDVSRTPFSFLLRDCWRYKGIILGAPTYDGGVYLPMDNLVNTLAHKRLQKRVCGLFGSYTWSGGAVKKMHETLEGLKWEIVGPEVPFTSHPSEEDLRQAEEMGAAVARQVMS
ncbi:MAG: FprA family A-type flavoprotein [Candidatus Geothermincolia bacterium]